MNISNFQLKLTYADILKGLNNHSLQDKNKNTFDKTTSDTVDSKINDTVDSKLNDTVDIQTSDAIDIKLNDTIHRKVNEIDDISPPKTPLLPHLINIKVYHITKSIKALKCYAEENNCNLLDILTFDEDNNIPVEEDRNNDVIAEIITEDRNDELTTGDNNNELIVGDKNAELITEDSQENKQILLSGAPLNCETIQKGDKNYEFISNDKNNEIEEVIFKDRNDEKSTTIDNTNVLQIDDISITDDKNIATSETTNDEYREFMKKQEEKRMKINERQKRNYQKRKECGTLKRYYEKKGYERVNRRFVSFDEFQTKQQQPSKTELLDEVSKLKELLNIHNIIF